MSNYILTKYKDANTHRFVSSEARRWNWERRNHWWKSHRWRDSSEVRWNCWRDCLHGGHWHRHRHRHGRQVRGHRTQRRGRVGGGRRPRSRSHPHRGRIRLAHAFFLKILHFTVIWSDIELHWNDGASSLWLKPEYDLTEPATAPVISSKHATFRPDAPQPQLSFIVWCFNFKKKFLATYLYLRQIY